jgi:hypothetical protein
MPSDETGWLVFLFVYLILITAVCSAYSMSYGGPAVNFPFERYQGPRNYTVLHDMTTPGALLQDYNVKTVYGNWSINETYGLYPSGFKNQAWNPLENQNMARCTF